MKLTFLGAAGEVTGSQHLIETDARRLLLDCGFVQGRRAESRRRNERFQCRPKKLDAVVLSHAHIDHSGNLPGLYRAGFRGPVFCSDATADVVQIMLRDSAKIQAEEVRYLERHLKPGHPSVEPLYTEEDVDGVVKQFEPLPFDEWHELAPDVRLRLSDAGHILGSAIVELDLEDGDEWKRLVFTGDLGRRGLPILRDPTPVERCDVLISESTYGNRVHPAASDLKAELLRVISEANAVGGRVIIPAFSLGRTQQVVYFLNELHNEGKLPVIPMFVDSPLARRLTSVFRDHKSIMNANVQDLLETDADPFGFPGLAYVASQAESIALNRRKGTFVVISASGMCENGRVVHHLKHAVSDERNTIALIGYQAGHTLGRRIHDRQSEVKIFDRLYPLKAHVEVLDGLSGHADVEDFRWWFGEIAKAGGIGQAFLVHGEPESSQALAQVLDEFCDEEPVLPKLGETFEV